jgi:hypothetical protein
LFGLRRAEADCLRKLLATDDRGADQTLLPPTSGQLLSNTRHLWHIRSLTTAYALGYFTQPHIRILSNAEVFGLWLCSYLDIYVEAAALFVQIFVAGLIVRLVCFGPACAAHQMRSFVSWAASQHSCADPAW